MIFENVDCNPTCFGHVTHHIIVKTYEKIDHRLNFQHEMEKHNHFGQQLTKTIIFRHGKATFH